MKSSDCLSAIGCCLIVTMATTLIFPPGEAASVSVSGPVSNSRRSKRSIVTMRNMVRAVTGIEALRFIGYANWCGYGGNGKILDPVDECCYQHDKCFDRVHSMRQCAHLTGYQTNYNWRWVASETRVECTDKTSSCQFAFCDCDRVFAVCLRDRQRHFKPSRYALPSIVTALYYGTYVCWFMPVCWVMGPEFDALRYAFLAYHLT